LRQIRPHPALICLPLPTPPVFFSLLPSGQVPFCLSGSIRHCSPGAGDCMSRALPHCLYTLPRRAKNRTPTKAAGPKAQHQENSKSHASLSPLHNSPHTIVVESCLPRVGRSPTLTPAARVAHPQVRPPRDRHRYPIVPGQPERHVQACPCLPSIRNSHYNRLSGSGAGINHRHGRDRDDATPDIPYTDRMSARAAHTAGGPSPGHSNKGNHTGLDHKRDSDGTGRTLRLH